MSRRFAFIANPRSPRAIGFAAACPEARLISWESVLAPDFDPETQLSGIETLRIDTPAGSLAVERRLLALGAGSCSDEARYPQLPLDDCLKLPDDPGGLRFQRQHYLGWCMALDMIDRATGLLKLRTMNSPPSIGILFDKLETHSKLSARDIPVPPTAGLCLGFDDLLSIMDRHGWNRVFLKPSHGSSASGVMAIARHPRGHWQADTSTCLTADHQILNSKRVLRITDLDEIRRTVDAVCLHRALVEKWFPKISINGRSIDLRILVIAGRAAHIAVRSSKSPITNLHLANTRGEPDQLSQLLGDEKWNACLRTAEAAAGVFPDCHYLGVDLMIGARHHQPAIAEINAFGDHLHHERWQGMNPWEAELALWPVRR
jgi:glutathione synthase/RimK-type ligase-like ATP-grasp enzyme